MARPAKNSCDYFPHDNGMRNHRKIKALRNKFTNSGYCFYCMFLEYLTGADGNVFENSDLELELLSGDFGFSVTEISEMLNFCIKIELLFRDDNFIYSESLNERLAPVYLKRGKAKELSSKQKRLNGKYITEITEQPEVTVTEIPQSKVKEIKVKEIEIVFPESFSEKRTELFKTWINYKYEQFKFRYKSTQSINALFTEFELMTDIELEAAIQKSMASGYKGIIKNELNKKKYESKYI